MRKQHSEKPCKLVRLSHLLTDNGNGTYTVANADESFTTLAVGDVFSYEYADGDLLIAKGMGNYESVESFADKTVCMLLMAKCVPVANNLGARIGDFVCRVKNAELMR